jgi:hypothetical protein
MPDTILSKTPLLLSPNEVISLRRSITNKEVASTKANNVATSVVFNVQSN